MIEKSLVKKNFSRAASSYDQYAVVQEHMGEKLASWLNKEKKLENILEIGAGTGLFTEFLVNKFPESEYLLVDISPEMIQKSKERFEEWQNIEYLVADGERLNLREKFDLITSNATFQWFQNFKQAIRSFKESLRDNGKIYFSTFGSRNFWELRTCFKEISERYNYSQRFYSKEELKELLKCEFEKVHIEEDEYIESFTRVRDFLKAIKKLGANSARKDKPVLTPGLLKKLESKYKNRFTEKGKITVTHHLLFVKLEK